MPKLRVCWIRPNKKHYHPTASHVEEVIAARAVAADKNFPPGTLSVVGLHPRLDRHDVEEIKDGVYATPDDWVGVTPNGAVITNDPDGQTRDHGPVEQFTYPPSRTFFFHQIRISLQLKHASQDLTSIAEAFGLPVIGMYAMGHARRTTQGEPLEGTYQDSALRVRVRSSCCTLLGAIEVVRQAFLAAPPDVRQMLCAPDLKKSLYCFSR